MSTSPDPLPARHGPTLPQFLAALSEWFPAAYVRAYSGEFGKLWEDGCSARLAANYARAYLLAPRIELDAMDAQNPHPF